MTALRIVEALLSKEPSNTDLQLQQATIHSQIGEAERKGGNSFDAINNYTLAITMLERLIAFDPSNVSWARQLARTQAQLADSFTEIGKFDEARAQYKSALVIEEELAKKRPEDAQVKRSIETLNNKVKSLEAKEREPK